MRGCSAFVFLSVMFFVFAISLFFEENILRKRKQRKEFHLSDDHKLAEHQT